MEDFELKKMIYSFIKEICHYSQMQVFATSYYQKNYFQMQIDERVTALMTDILQYSKKTDTVMVRPIVEEIAGGRLFTLEELSQYDGSDGKEAYVAVSGVVYDVSGIIAWAGGTHFGLSAGKELTTAFEDCHQGSVELLEKIPRIGILIV